MNTPESTIPETPVTEQDSPTTTPAPTEAPRKAPRTRKAAARKGQMFKMVASPEIQQRYETACKRLESSAEALNREVWEMVKSELESLYEFKPTLETPAGS